MKTALITLLAAIGLATAHAQNGWRTYRNNAAGWSITYPANLTLQPPSPDAVAMESSSQWRIKDFQSKDGEVELLVETHSMNADTSLQENFDYEVSNRTQGGDYINYSVIKDNCYVISGTNAKRYEFYKKYFDFGDWWISFDFIYPRSEHRFYDPMVAKIARDFNPRLPGNYDH
jgi:hypothetical protein